MRSYKKKQLLDILSDLEKINDWFPQCRQAAIIIGNDIESRGEEETIPFILLPEQYCEDIYQLSTNFSGKEQCKKLTEEGLQPFFVMG